jgi:hypothetical protein
MTNLNDQINQAKATPNQEVKVNDNCYYLFDGLTLYKIENAGEWDSDWIVTNADSNKFVQKFYKLDKAIKSTQW